MTSPKPVAKRLRNRIAFFIALFFMGLPALGIWIYFHLAAIGLICSCVPGNLFPEWSVGANTLGGVVSLLAMMFGNWYLWTRWRSYRLEKKVAAAYQKKHDPWYTKTGDERPKGPIKNKYYEP